MNNPSGPNPGNPGPRQNRRFTSRGAAARRSSASGGSRATDPMQQRWFRVFLLVVLAFYAFVGMCTNYPHRGVGVSTPIEDRPPESNSSAKPAEAADDDKGEIICWIRPGLPLREGDQAERRRITADQ